MAYYMPEIAFCSLALGFLHGTTIARNSSHPNLEIGPKLLEQSRETSERKKFGRPEVTIQIHGVKKKSNYVKETLKFKTTVIISVHTQLVL